MKKTLIICSLIFLLCLTSICSTAAEDITITILKTDGLSQYSYNNYTLDCQKSGTNIITVIVKTNLGNSYITVVRNLNNTWVSSGVQQLDRDGNVYLFGLSADSTYRLRVTVDTGNTTIFRDFFITASGGAGQFISGDISQLTIQGQWVNNMIDVYDRGSYEDFKKWSQTAMQWYENPLYMVIDFLTTLAMLFVIPQVDFLIITAVAIVILFYRKRIKQTWEARQLERKYGKVEDKMAKQRAYEEKERLRELEAYPTEKALIKYGSGDARSRATAYHQGIRQYDGATFSTAYSLVHLGELLFNEDEKANQRGEQIVEMLAEHYHSTLEKSWIFMDIAACCRALSSEAVDVKTQMILKDKWMEISRLAETRASEEVAKATKNIQLSQNQLTFEEVIRKQREKRVDEGKTE